MMPHETQEGDIKEEHTYPYMNGIRDFDARVRQTELTVPQSVHTRAHFAHRGSFDEI